VAHRTDRVEDERTGARCDEDRQRADEDHETRM
jgi:hypothetical protein